MSDREIRQQGLLLARESLVRDYNLTLVKTVEEGRYKGEQLTFIAFKKPHAPKIKVNSV